MKLPISLKLALNYLVKQKNDFGFPINDVCRFHLKNGADIDDIAINANVSEVGFNRSFGVMVNYRYELAKNCFKTVPVHADLDILKFSNIFEH